VSVTDPIAAPPQSSGSRTKIIAVIVVLAAFACGIVAGAVGDRIWMFRHGPVRGPASHFIADRILKRLDRELKLTPQQHEQVKKIIETHRARVEGVFDAVKPQVHHEIEAANDEIRTVLTPEQRQKYEQLRMKMHPHHGEH